MSFPRYERYKNSGVEELGEVPAHWAISRLGYEAWVRARLGWKGLKAEEYVEEGFALLATPNIKGAAIDFDDVNYITEDRYNESPEIMLRVGDVLLAKDGSTLGTVNIVLQLPKPSTVNSSIAVITPGERLQPLFLHYLFCSEHIENVIQQLKGGMGVPHLFQDDLTKFYLPLPPKDEQSAIAAFLDRETAKIDVLVDEQNRLIELLKEKRQAVISDAVTKGLDPNVPMKDSSVEWMGQVPEHWEVVSLGKVTIDKCDGPFGSGLKSEHYADCGVRVVRLQNIRRGGFDDTDAAFISEEHYRSGLGGGHDVRRGDILIAGLGDERNTVGRACVAPEGIGPAMVKADCFRFRLRGEKAAPEFVAAQLTSGSLPDAGAMATGATRLRIPLASMASRKLALPPLSEQWAIAQRLREEIPKFEELISQAEHAIDLLRERRSALISAAITGKIDVRGAGTRVDPLAQPDRGRIRLVIAAEIIQRLSPKPTFGRVKLQKLAYLAETHANVSELGGSYLREAAGPLDRDMIEEMETKLRSDGFVSVEQPGGSGATVTYRVRRRGGHHEEAAAILGSRGTGLKRLIDLLGDLETRSVEAIATLYAVWNDAILDGVVPTDDFVISAFLNDWHPEKAKKFRPTDLRSWLDWMRRHELTPRGTGPRTITGRLFV